MIALVIDAQPAAGGPTFNIRAASVTEGELVARLRSRCYRASYHLGTVTADAARIGREDLAAGDVLITEREGRPVATATSLRGEMNVRGSVLPCQGIAWVGTTHDARRAGGVASKTMHHALALARERGEALSALMPFRASYYESFGYGLCERRANWRIPPALLPRGDTSGFRLIEPDDDAALEQMRQCRERQLRHARLGHGDVWFPDTPASGLEVWRQHFADSGYLFGDYASDGTMRGWLAWVPKDVGGRRGLDVQFTVFDTADGFMRQMAFLGTLRDQYGLIHVATPADRPIHLLLGETQLPHRGVEHPHATCEVTARNQVRVLDHARVLSEPAWPDPAREGSVIVQIDECEGYSTRLKLDVAGGRCQATPTEASPDFTCADTVWAPIVLGELNAAWAATHGLASGDPGLLVDVARGPIPFCREYF